MDMDMHISGYVEYTTKDGDTFDALAIAAYNNEKMASYIIDHNRQYAGTLIFEAGIKLQIPMYESTAAPETLPPWRR